MACLCTVHAVFPPPVKPHIHTLVHPPKCARVRTYGDTLFRSTSKDRKGGKLSFRVPTLAERRLVLKSVCTVLSYICFSSSSNMRCCILKFLLSRIFYSLEDPFRREYSSVYFVCFVPFKCKPYQPIHPQNFSEYANAGIAISVGSRAHSMSCRRFLSQVVTDRRGETRKNRSATIYTSILILCTCAHVLRIAPYVLRALCDLSLPKCMDRS